MKDSRMENIAHITDGYAYSVHRTVTSEDMREALYLHVHPEFEFLFLKKGELEFYVGPELITLMPGEAVFIPSNVMHYALSEGACEYRAVVFSGEFLESEDEKRNGRGIIPFHLNGSYAAALHLTNAKAWQRKILSGLNDIFEICDEKDAIRKELFVKGELLIAWQLLTRFHFANTDADINTQTFENLKKAVAFIEKNYVEDISLSVLSKEACMSKSHFCRKFKAHTGLAPFEYLNRYRIMKACGLLKESLSDIKEICFECGYNNVSYFNREFKKLMDCTPKEYRKKV